MMQPHAFPRRVLLSVTGLTPQVVTETIHALAVTQTPAFRPTELVIITTSDGAENVRLTLRGDDPGWIGRLCKDFSLPVPRFAPDDLRVLRARDGSLLSDIRTEEENMCAADAITETIRELTSDPECALHVSMAGGRKTLGFFAAYALSLYGRPQDRLSHVLVSDKFEGNRDFYYPTPYSRVIYTREGQPIDTMDARVILADIPFVSLRAGLPTRLIGGKAGYREAVEALREAQQTPSLVIDLRNRTVIAGGRPISLQLPWIAFLAWVARYSKRGETIAWKSNLNTTEANEISHAYAREYLTELGQLTSLEENRTAKLLQLGMDPKFLRESRSKLNKALADALDVKAFPYQVQQLGQRRVFSRYGLTLPPKCITILE